MYLVKITLYSIVAFFTTLVYSQSKLDRFLSDFDYESRKEMKVSSEQLVKLLQDNQAVLVDIRFEEEQNAWQMDYAIKMPLSTIPSRYNELPKDKLIVTACPHKDRAIIAMVYLIEKGYKVAYLSEGLLGLADYLRGDKAKSFIDNFKN